MMPKTVKIVAPPRRSTRIWLYRIGLICLFGFGLLICYRSIEHSKVDRDKGTHIGKFWVPPLHGWHKTVYNDQRIRNVKYSKNIDNDSVVAVTFTVWKTLPNTSQPTIQTLEEDVGQWLKYEESLSARSVSGSHISTKRIKFRSWPGFSTSVQKRDGDKTVQIKYLHFIAQNKKYMLTAATEGTPPLDDAIQIQVAAWNILTRNLRPLQDDNALAGS